MDYYKVWRQDLEENALAASRGNRPQYYTEDWWAIKVYDKVRNAEMSLLHSHEGPLNAFNLPPDDQAASDDDADAEGQGDNPFPEEPESIRDAEDATATLASYDSACEAPKPYVQKGLTSCHCWPTVSQCCDAVLQSAFGEAARTSAEAMYFKGFRDAVAPHSHSYHQSGGVYRHVAK